MSDVKVKAEHNSASVGTGEVYLCERGEKIARKIELPLTFSVKEILSDFIIAITI